MTNFTFTRKDFYNAIANANDVDLSAIAETLETDVEEIRSFAQHTLNAVNKPRKMSDKKVKEREDVENAVLDAIPYDEPITLAEIASKTDFSTQKIVAAISRLTKSGIVIEKSLIDKRAAYKRIVA